jgi:hypothetical protein
MLVGLLRGVCVAVFRPALGLHMSLKRQDTRIMAPVHLSLKQKCRERRSED